MKLARPAPMDELAPFMIGSGPEWPMMIPKYPAIPPSAPRQNTMASSSISGSTKTWSISEWA